MQCIPALREAGQKEGTNHKLAYNEQLISPKYLTAIMKGEQGMRII